jgi:acetolactate synthase-1/2/3 large subunit
MATVIFFLIRYASTEMINPILSLLQRLLYQKQKGNQREDLDAAVAEMMASKDLFYSKLW